jgi:AraC family transcriptional regulator
VESLTKAGAVYESAHLDGSTMAHHRHDAAYATIVLQGSYVEVRDAVPERCFAGTIVVHGTGEEHADRFAGATRCLNVELPPSSKMQARSAVARDAESRAAARDVVRAFYDGSPGLSAAVRSLWSALNGVNWTPAERPAWLREIMESFSWIEQVSLRTAARMAGVHETHFSRAFRQHVGMTPSEFRWRARVRRASSLLLESATPLAHVAAACGFSDQSHLTRAFADRIGLTPAAYRRTFTR